MSTEVFTIESERQSATIDARDRAILARRLALWDLREGPRVGDFAIFADGTTHRFSYDWGESGIQTSKGGSYYLGEGYMSMSGGLDPEIKRERIHDTDETRLGSCWFFHHDYRTAGGGVDVLVPCRVFRIDGLR